MAVDAAHLAAGKPLHAVVGTCGTALTAAHAQVLKHHATADRPLVLVIDNDDNNSGLKALLRAWPLINTWPAPVSVVTPQGAKDLADIYEDSQRGPQEVARQLEQARPLLDTVIDADLHLNWDPAAADEAARHEAAADIVAARVWEYLQAVHEREPTRGELESLALAQARRASQLPWNVPLVVTLARILLGPAATRDEQWQHTAQQRARELADTQSPHTLHAPQSGETMSDTATDESAKPAASANAAPQPFSQRIMQDYLHPDRLTRLAKTAATRQADVPDAAAEATAPLQLPVEEASDVAAFWSERHPLAQFDTCTKHALETVAAGSRREERQNILADAAQSMRTVIEEYAAHAQEQLAGVLHQAPVPPTGGTVSPDVAGAARDQLVAAEDDLIKDLTLRLAQTIGSAMDRAAQANLGAGGLRHQLHQIVGWDGTRRKLRNGEQIAFFRAAAEPICGAGRQASRSLSIRLGVQPEETRQREAHWQGLIGQLPSVTVPIAETVAGASRSSSPSPTPTPETPHPTVTREPRTSSQQPATPTAVLTPGFQLTLTALGDTPFTTDNRSLACMRLSKELKAFLDAHRLARRADAADPAPYGQLRTIPLTISAEQLDTDDPALVLRYGNPPQAPLRLPRSALADLHGSRLLAAVEWQAYTTTAPVSHALTATWFAELTDILPEDRLDNLITKDEFVDLLRTYTAFHTEEGLTDRVRERANEAVALFTLQRPGEALVRLAGSGHRWIRLGPQGWTHQPYEAAHESPADTPSEIDPVQGLADLRNEAAELFNQVRALNQDADAAAASPPAQPAAQPTAPLPAAPPQQADS
ncbi:hypothetical protein AB0B67_43330, partial [Streptomyces spectabilis]